LTAPKENDGCIFCNAGTSGPSAETLTVHRDETAVVMLNRYPYTNGHLMVAPLRHMSRLYDSREDELMSLIRLAAMAQRYLSEIYNPDGFNVGMNFGEVAGAGIADHYHLHVVPRWGGDANFMSVTAQTRMVPENLETTYEKVRARFASVAH
jgi:ATP adenylyltransferase